MYNSGVEFLTKKKFSQAISEFDKLINKNRRDADADYSRGLAYALQGKYAPAIADFTHYLEVEERTPTPTATGAWPGSSRVNMTRAWLT